jgi:hypothetical protein
MELLEFCKEWANGWRISRPRSEREARAKRVGLMRWLGRQLYLLYYLCGHIELRIVPDFFTICIEIDKNLAGGSIKRFS